MVTRKAILIGYPGEVGQENYCEGVKHDLDNYRSFLQSPIGGYWFSSEIETLNTPMLQVVRNQISSLQQYDYSLVVFSGHGGYDEHRESTVVELNNHEILDSSELTRNRSRKHTLILDCCRKPVPPTLFEYAEMVKLAKLFDGPLSRQYYDEWIAECDPGVVILFSCSIGEASADNELFGGLYSYHLIREAKKWADSRVLASNEYEVHSVVAAHNEARPTVVRASGQTQHPGIQKDKSTPKFFPFAIAV